MASGVGCGAIRPAPRRLSAGDCVGRCSGKFSGAVALAGAPVRGAAAWCVRRTANILGPVRPPASGIVTPPAKASTCARTDSEPATHSLFRSESAHRNKTDIEFAPRQRILDRIIWRGFAVMLFERGTPGLITGRRPLILTLDVHGQPYRWVSWQHAITYYARDQVAWAAGEHEFTFLGGTRNRDGQRSRLTTNSIIAIKGKALSSRALHQVPPLSNRELFHRDRQICAYCGDHLPVQRLTRDHIVPVSRGGRDIWMNVTTACRYCNQRKAGRTPEQAGMELLFAPYVPNKAEYLILCNRNILADQMDFLARHVPSQSRVHLI